MGEGLEDGNKDCGRLRVKTGRKKTDETVRAEGCYDTKILSLAGRGERDRRKAGCGPPMRDEASEREMERACSFERVWLGGLERGVWGNERGAVVG